MKSAAGLLYCRIGESVWLNGAGAGFPAMMAGIAIIALMLIGWFGQFIGESEDGRYNRQFDISFRTGMFWFIFQEVRTRLDPRLIFARIQRPEVRLTRTASSMTINTGFIRSRVMYISRQSRRGIIS